MAVKLLIDSASDISMSEAEKLGIYMIPMSIRMGDEDYLDGVNLLPNEFYTKLIESTELPKTSQINEFTFAENFEELTANGDDVVCITISSKLSGTYYSACQAATNFEGKVFVVDSLNACIGERLLGQYAHALIKEGKSAQEVANSCDEIKSKINVIAVIDTLEFLVKGGRLSKTAGFVGNLLSLKPVVGVIDGEVKVIGKAMGSKKANNLLNALVEKKGGINFDMPYGVVWSGTDKTMLDKYVADSSHLWSHATDMVPEYILGATIGTHVGPGVAGVAFFEK